VQKHLNKIIILAAALLLVGCFFYFDLQQYLTLSYLKSSQARFAELYANNRTGVIAIYMGIYILATALSLPGAVILTLAGGALFGLVVGTIVVSFASTIGATLACFVSRFLLRDWVQAKFGDRLVTVNEGIEAEGAFYLFTLRLIPVFPFFVINLVMGLTQMSFFVFFWASQLGMLAGTIVYVNAGKELAKIDSLSGNLSPGLIISFIILGLFPITVKKGISLYKAKVKKI